MSNLLSKASILLTPTATSDGKLHNIKPNTTTGDFTFTRGTTATRVNSSGLIESVASGLPRIDFTGGTGQVLLEPASTNLITYSEDFSQWTLGSNSTLTFESNVAAPDGSLGVYRLTLPASSQTFIQSPSYASGSGKVLSVFAKKTNTANTNFNFYDGTTVSDLKTTTEEWQRFEVSGSGTSAFIVNSLDNYITDIYIWGFQVEVQSFATSYIPTSSSSVTRNQDTANNAGDTSLISSTQGVLYAEIAALANESTQKGISLSNASIQNTVEFFIQSNLLRFRIRANDTNIFLQNITVSDSTQFLKVAFKYKSGDIEAFINGVKELDRTDSFTFSASLSELAFDRGSNQNIFQGKIKTVAVFKEALTDAQLISLTS